MSASRSYFIRLLLFSAFASIIILLWEQFASQQYQTNLAWVILLFFMVMTTIIHFSLVRASKKEPQKFITRFLTITGLRLFGYLIIILIYALLKRQAALGFTLMFLVMYLLFSVFEVISLFKLLKK